MSATVTDVQIVRLTHAVGAVIHGVDPHADDIDRVAGTVRQAVIDHQVVFLPGLDLDTEAQIVFTHRLGRPNPAHPVRGTAHSELPEVFVSTSYPLEWHADHTYMPEPSSLSSLQAIEAPTAGGDTQWASGVAAYATLSEPLQRLAESLTTIHTPSASLVQLLQQGPGWWNDRPVTALEPTEHPLVVRHESGRPALFVNPSSWAMPGSTTIPGLRQHESDRLLALFVDHYTRPEHSVRHRWTTGTLAIWDNRVTLHRPVLDHDHTEPRRLHRVSLQGERPRAWAPDAITSPTWNPDAGSQR